MKSAAPDRAESAAARRPGMKDSRSYYKSMHSIMAKDQADLKEQIEALKRENLDLKKSLFDLSMRHEAALSQLQAGSRHPFDLDAIVGSGSGVAGGAAEASGASAAEGRGSYREGSEPLWGDRGPVERRAVADGSSRQFAWEYDLKGHTGAVYAVRFSACGSLLASGSFDKTVRVWSVDGDVHREMLCLSEHQLNVSDLAWSAGSERLISGAFDQTVKEWDVKAGVLRSSHDVAGLVQTVAYGTRNPTARPAVHRCATELRVVGWAQIRRTSS